MKKLDLSLVIPCYNEGPTLPESLRKIFQVLRETRYSFEIILIDDCSRDETVKHLKKFARNKKNVQVYQHLVNVGRGGTVKEGIETAKGEVAGFIDVDLEVSAVYIPEFTRAILQGADVAIARRLYSEKFVSLNRWIASKAYIKLVNSLLKIDFKDTEAGYKFFNRQKILPVLKKVQDDKWFFDTEIVVRSFRKGLTVSEIPVLFLRRYDKKSTVRLIPDTIAYLKAISKFKRQFKSQKSPR